MDYCCAAIFLFYTIELVCKVGMHYVAREGYSNVQPRFSLRNLFNVLDLVAVVSFWVNLVLVFAGAPEGWPRQLLTALSALRALRLLRITPGTEAETTLIFEAIKHSRTKLGKVAPFICFFWLLFAVIGMQTFKSSLKRSCTPSITMSTDSNMSLIAPKFSTAEATSFATSEPSILPGQALTLGLIATVALDLQLIGDTFALWEWCTERVATLTVGHCVGLRVHDPGSIPSSLTHGLVRAGLSAHNASWRRYRSQSP
jgi:hypothetical protein